MLLLWSTLTEWFPYGRVLSSAKHRSSRIGDYLAVYCRVMVLLGCLIGYHWTLLRDVGYLCTWRSRFSRSAHWNTHTTWLLVLLDSHVGPILHCGGRATHRVCLAVLGPQARLLRMSSIWLTKLLLLGVRASCGTIRCRLHIRLRLIARILLHAHLFASARSESDDVGLPAARSLT